jgi:multiple sugar transport system substrate-binding protein
MVRRNLSQSRGSEPGSRVSRRRAMQLGIGAAAAYGMMALPPAPERVGAQATGAADVTGPFDWKRHDGTTIRALLNEHPYTTALEEDLQTFTDLTDRKSVV